MKLQPVQVAHSDTLTRQITDALAAAGLSDSAAAYVCDTSSSSYGEWRSDADIYPASVIKVPVMAEAFRQYAQGRLSPDTDVWVSAENQTTTDQPTPLATGYRATVSELVELMITLSDNVATNQLMDVLGRERVTDHMRALGLETFLLGRKLSGSEPLIVDPGMVGRNRLPPNEIARLLLLIAQDQLPGAPEQRAILRRCVHNEKLVPALRSGDVFMHKTGETSDVSHDAGILHTAEGKDYIVVLYMQVTPNPDGSDAAHANSGMTQWMRTLRAHL